MKRVIQSLHVSHLSPEEKDYVFGWAEDYADIFYLNGEKLTSTYLIQHRIATIDDKIIVKKQYRSPHEATEQIHAQIEKQYKSGIIGSFKSPYNSPLLIVPKKLDVTLKKDLQKSFSQFEKSVERKGLDISNINPDSLYWDHEGMDTMSVPVCTHVSEGEEDEELLENLKALDRHSV